MQWRIQASISKHGLHSSTQKSANLNVLIISSVLTFIYYKYLVIRGPDPVVQFYFYIRHKHSKTIF